MITLKEGDKAPAFNGKDQNGNKVSLSDFKGKKVLDYGCGTGILSILAAKEGAAKVTGVDIQPEAIENSYEHAEINDVAPVCEFYLGGLERTDDEIYDVILANINRNVIIDSLPELKKKLKPDGYLLISGIMFDDVQLLDKHLTLSGMQIKE